MPCRFPRALRTIFTFSTLPTLANVCIRTVRTRYHALLRAPCLVETSLLRRSALLRRMGAHGFVPTLSYGLRRQEAVGLGYAGAIAMGSFVRSHRLALH